MCLLKKYNRIDTLCNSFTRPPIDTDNFYLSTTRRKMHSSRESSALHVQYSQSTVDGIQNGTVSFHDKLPAT